MTLRCCALTNKSVGGMFLKMSDGLIRIYIFDMLNLTWLLGIQVEI